MSDYKIVHECDHCHKPDLHCETLACGRHLCPGCKKEVECPCKSCQAILPAFKLINPKCSECKAILTDKEVESKNSICQGCETKRVNGTSIIDLLYQLCFKILSCGTKLPVPVPAKKPRLPALPGFALDSFPSSFVLDDPDFGLKIPVLRKELRTN